MAGWDEQRAKLEAEFSGWHIWRSDAGRWWATRTGVVLRREPLGAGRVMTVDADDLGSLRNHLLTQAELDQEVTGLTEPARLWTTLCAPIVQNSVDNRAPLAGLIERVMHMP